MDAKLVFWTLSLVNLGVVVGLALHGVRAIRQGRVEAHRRSMRVAGLLVAAFLLAYLLKLWWLGGEDKSHWSALAQWNLYIHEAFVIVMLLSGLLAWALAMRFAKSARVSGDPSDPAASPVTLRAHRILGRIAVISAAGGLLTACFVLAGMIARAH